MKIIDKLSSFLKMNDIFYSAELLRYQKQNHYQTVTGGFLSLVIWITIIVSFASMIIETFNLTNITSQQTIIKHNNPPKMQIKMQKGSNFMFGIRMIDLAQNVFNLNDQKRYFDIFLTKVYFKGGLVVNAQNVPTEQCTKEHWSDFPNIQSDYDILQMNNWLCPLRDTILDLKGMSTSQFSSSVAFRIVSCNNYTNTNSICASPEQIDNLMANRTNFAVNLFFTNPVINPNKKDFIDYYLQQQGNGVFSKIIGFQNLIYLADYTITSDHSYWPFASVEQDYGSILDGAVMNRPITINQAKPVYANIVIFKSSASLMIKREVQKISSVFSYIGGFFGAITAALFIIKTYTDSAFQFSLAANLFQRELKESTEQKQGESFHFFKYLGMNIYGILQKFGFKKRWEKVDKILQEQQEVKNHLNIVGLLRRVITIEDYLTYLFEDYQIQGIKMQKNKTLNHIKQLRKKFSQQQKDENQQIKSAKSDIKIVDSNTNKRQLQVKGLNEKDHEIQNSSKPIVLTQKENIINNRLDFIIECEEDDAESIDVLKFGNNIPFSIACEVIKGSQFQTIDKANEILNKLKESSASNSISKKILSRIPEKMKKSG